MVSADVLQVLDAEQWAGFAEAHAERADALTAAHRARRSTGEKHVVEDFLYDYYGTRPALLRRWHPGAGVGLRPGPGQPVPPQAQWRWYDTTADGVVALDVAAYLADRGDAVRFIHRILSATAARPALTGCFGMHEWAMTYRGDEHRHALPLRLGQAGTDAVVESAPVRCTHFDAFRFFTPEAVPLNQVQLSRATQVEHEQPGCLHAAMDCHRWALKLGPAVPGELALDCFALAADVRTLDMQASPYDLSSYGLAPVPVETPEGKSQYVAQQREFAHRSAGLRARLIAACEDLLTDGERAGAPSSPPREHV